MPPAVKYFGWLVFLPVAVYACLNDMRENAEFVLNRLWGPELTAHSREVMAKKSSDPALTAKFTARAGDTEEVRQATAAVAKIISGKPVQAGTCCCK